MKTDDLKQEGQCAIHDVRRSYLDKVKDDLIISKEKFSKCRKYSEKWKFYRDHIEWLESEMVSLS
jgi:hypothetical protein